MTEQEIFIEAMDRTDRAEQQRFLDEACAGDAALRDRVEKLINQADQLGSFLEHPPVQVVVEDGFGSAGGGDLDATILHGAGSTEVNGDATALELTMKHDAQEQDDEIPLGYLQPSTNPNSLGRLGHYEVLEVIGRGAFGTVLRAFDEKLQRVVAIKVLAPEMAATSPARKRFLREARTSAAIRHENVVAIHAVEDEPIPYLVMEYVPGQTLQQRLDKSGPLSVLDVLKLGKQIADGLAAAHAQDLIHRDIKPGNILLEGGVNERVKITDFGLARTADDASVTQSGFIAGTPMYMAPEQAMGLKLDQRADLFSLGSVLYQMLSGRPPFRAANTVAVLKRVVDDTPRPIQEIIPEVPTWMCELVSQLHAKNPDERIQTAKEVSDLLGQCLDEFKAGRVPKVMIRSHNTATMEFRSGNAIASPEAPQTAKTPRVRIAATVLVLLAIIAVIAGFQSEFLFSKPGTVTIQCDDPELVISVDNMVVSLNPFRHPGGVAEKHSRTTTIGLAPGEHRVQLMKGGRLVHEQVLMVQSGKSAVVQLAVPNDQANVTSKPAKPNVGVAKAEAPSPAIAPFNADQAKVHQEAWAKHLGVPVEYTNSIGMKFRLIPPGEFMMGSTPEEIEAALKETGDEKYWQECVKSEAPQHTVILTQPIYLGVHEVTQAVYEKVMGVNPSYFGPMGMGKEAVAGLETAEHPVEMVSWNDAAEFCAKLSRQEQHKPFDIREGEKFTPLDGTGYRLPTEAEWEFACRAGTATKYWIGDKDENLIEVGWFSVNSGGRTHSAGELRANPFGLFDIHGNVWERVLDGWIATWYGQFSQKSAVNPLSPIPADTLRMFRGGSFQDLASNCRSSNRQPNHPTDRYPNIGFRVSLSVDAVKAALAARTPAVTNTKPDAPSPAIAPFDAAQAKAHQEAWAKHLGVPVEYTNALGMKFVLIPPGEFTMGSTPEEIAAALGDVPPDNKHFQECIKSEAPQHKVILTQPIYLGVNEVTQAEYEKVMGSNPSDFAPMGMGKEAVAGLETAEHPVETVSWNDAVEFCAKLSKQEKLKPFYFRAGETITPLDGTGYRLPSEAEWEFACRAGTATSYWIGDKDEDLVRAGCFGGNSGGRTHAAGELKANPFGLYDIHGNVWEWVQDGWDATYYGQFSPKPTINPISSFSAGSQRVIRGGGWNTPASFCRSSGRYAVAPPHGDHSIGFRVSLSVDAVKEVLAARTPAVTNTKPDAPSPAIAPFNAAQAKAHQEAWAKHLGVPVEYTNSIGMKFRLIPPGEFMMGSTPEEIEAALKDAPVEQTQWRECIKSEAPQHKVVLTQPIYLGMTEVTQGEYQKVMSTNPSSFAPTGQHKDLVAGIDTSNQPVEMVTWNEAVEFCSKLSQQEKLKPFYVHSGDKVTALDGTSYRLPLEAEWEFACRAGTSTRYVSGDDEAALSSVCWFQSSPVHAVSLLKANPFGLYDMHGNVWEWIQDGWDASWYGRLQEKPAINPSSPFTADSLLVLRGGSWNTGASRCRASHRSAGHALSRDGSIGFRVSLPVDAIKQRLNAQAAATGSAKNAVSEPTAKRRFVSDEWIDVIPIVDPQTDKWDVPQRTGKNGWRVDGSELISDSDQLASKLILPLDSDWSAFEFEIEFTRRAGGSGFIVNLPTKLGECPLVFDAPGNSGGAWLGSRAKGMILKSGPQIATGQRSTLRVEVRRPQETDQVSVNLDGIEVGKWTGDRSVISNTSKEGFPHDRRLSLWIHPGGNEFVFHRIRVRMLDGGTAETLRPVSQTSSALPTPFKNSIGMEFVKVPKGKAWLGGGKDKLGDKEVEIPADFYLGKYEVTQDEWTQVMGENPSYFSRTGEGKDTVTEISDADLKRFPVEMVSWDDCQLFVAKLNERENETGWAYRLPTATEWEYACRGGPMTDKSSSAFDFYFAKPTNNPLREQASFGRNMGLNRTGKVGSHEANVLGIFDMHRNVWEWCDDRKEAANGNIQRVQMGGAWNHIRWRSAASNLESEFPSHRSNALGLRLARVSSGATP